MRLNHIFYHGTTYSPINKPFPGRLFYASTNFNYNSHFKEFFPELNEYVRRVQTVLQDAKSANDILVYFPIYSFWNKSGSEKHILQFDVHKASKWLSRSPHFDTLIRQLDSLGFGFDFVSDKALANLEVDSSMLHSNGKYYKMIIIPDCQELPAKTYTQLKRLAEYGANVVFQNKLPSDVTGFGNLDAKRAEMKTALSVLNTRENVKSGFVPSLIVSLGSKRETMADFKLDFIKKTTSRATVYFITNQNSVFSHGDIEISETCAQVEYYNPLSGERCALKAEHTEDGTKFNLRLLSGESCFVFANKNIDDSLKEKRFFSDDERIDIDSEWRIDFVRNLFDTNPKFDIPASITTSELKSWTELGDANAKKFCGVAKYTAKFELSDHNGNYAIDLGDVRDAARVKINGAYIGSAWCAPFRLSISSGILKNENLIEIEVTNNSFNLMRAIGAKNPDWCKNFFFVDITYKKFDITKKPVEASGLIGKVSLITQE